MAMTTATEMTTSTTEYYCSYCSSDAVRNAGLIGMLSVSGILLIAAGIIWCCCFFCFNRYNCTKRRTTPFQPNTQSNVNENEGISASAIQVQVHEPPPAYEFGFHHPGFQVVVNASSGSGDKDNFSAFDVESPPAYTDVINSTNAKI